MTAAEWAVLVPAVAALATAVAAWIRAQAAHSRITVQQGQISGIKASQTAVEVGMSQMINRPPDPPSTPTS